MKEFFRRVFEEAIVLLFCGAFFGAFATMLGFGESRTGRYSGIEPYWLMLGTFGIGIGSWFLLRKSGFTRDNFAWGPFRVAVFFLPSILFYMGATGIRDLTMVTGDEPKIPLSEAVITIYATWAVGFIISATIAGITAAFRWMRRDSVRQLAL